ncbi:MAG: fumarylacetoacetate hydrolase family protein [Pseudomonadota bacterium]
MRLVRVGAAGAERPALVDDDGTLRDLSGHVHDIAGPVLSPDGLAALAALDPGTLPALGTGRRLGPCVGGVGKLVCVGLNYTDHAAELGMPLPEEPILFGKAVTSLAGPNDDIEMPPGAEALDYEVELAIVIGSPAKHVAPERAMGCIAGYATFNDLSERRFQLSRGGQWIKGKSYDGFGPLGPWMVTRDSVPDVGALRLTLAVDGERRQDGSTARMIFGVSEIVSYISRFMRLEPGDVIPTGTPPGVAMGMKPAPWLKPGDVVEAEVEGLGRQRQQVVAHGA